MLKQLRFERSVIHLGMIAAFGFSAIFIWASTRPFMRANGFAHSVACFEHMLDHPTGQYQVLLIGSSRVEESFDPDRLARDWGVPSERVLNFGHPERDVLTDVRLIKEISETEPLKLVVMELHIPTQKSLAIERALDPSGAVTFSSPSGLHQEGLTLVTRYRDLTVGTQRMGVLARLYDVAFLVRKRLEISTRMILSARAFRILLPRHKGDPNRKNICLAPPGALARLQRATPTNLRMIANFRDSFAGGPEFEASDFMQGDNYSRDRIALRYLGQLARQRGFRVVLVYLPSTYMPAPDERSQMSIAGLVEGKFLVPPRELRFALAERGAFYDNAHPTQEGGIALSDWLANAIKSDVAEP